MMQIAIISNPSKLAGRLTKFFAGSPAYHIGFVDTERGKFYDMNLLFRRRAWPHYPSDVVTMYECPVSLSGDDLEYWLDTDTDWYGVCDYLAFGIRKVFPRFKGSYKGAICSEKVAEILVWKGWASPFDGFVPSPSDFEEVLKIIK